MTRTARDNLYVPGYDDTSKANAKNQNDPVQMKFGERQPRRLSRKWMVEHLCERLHDLRDLTSEE